ncbi:hypothetical protein NPX13_g8615 [Xylaria arbuscula]|uniref:Uncharacterized protein n=1 Tax=Xylaria arbuscula TaxID=114810 RepID=A0A9W8TIF6_9PEZI|nr:hypothetical protein NPX13_g8615 [Xylaria arbuscula]
MPIESEHSSQQQPSADCSTIRTATTFHQFSKLPAELRFAVWKEFEIPFKKGPWVFRHYIQVNREARREILNGCEVHMVHGKWQRSWLANYKARPMFVDWDLDLFCMPAMTPPSKMPYWADRETTRKIKNIAWFLPRTPDPSTVNSWKFYRAFRSVQRAIYLVELRDPRFEFRDPNESERIESPNLSTLPLNEYGYHNIEDAAHRYSRWLPLTGEWIPFVEMVDETARRAKKDLRKLLRRRV